jgi:hypothetical protein
MTSYLPDLSDVIAVAATLWAGLVLVLAGSALIGRQRAPELQLIAGWGALSILLTLWGVLTWFSLRIPAALFAALSLTVLAVPGLRPGREAWIAVGRALLLSLPLWTVVASMRPSQPDTWLNLLPNAAYVWDHGFLPADGRPPSYSFLALAPYNTQFAVFLAGLVTPEFPASGLSLFNVMLHLVAGLALARALSQAEEAAPSWGATAGGLLLATLLNPGFVPRFWFSAYGETGLAVTCLAAVVLGSQLLKALAEGRETKGLVWAIGLVLAALIDIKQEAIGLFAAVLASLFVVTLADSRIGLGKGSRVLFAAAAPAVMLYLVWRGYAGTSVADNGELKPLPFGLWAWANIPTILRSIAQIWFEKAVFFGLLLASLGLFGARARRRPWDEETRLLALNAGLFLAYNGFLVLAYIGHFQGVMSTSAHSYFRYSQHLALVLEMALIVALRPAALAWRGLPRRPLAQIAIAATLVAPVGFAKLLRFDLDEPQPIVWELGKKLADATRDDDRLALLLPGDNSSVTTMLRGVLRFTPPRRLGLDLWERPRADQATLAQARQAGYRLAFVSCVPLGSLANAPPGSAALLRDDGEGWHAVRVWAYDDGERERPWQRILSWEPLCRVE